MLKYYSCKHYLSALLWSLSRRRIYQTTVMAHARTESDVNHNIAAVRLIPGEERLQISLKYNPSPDDQPAAERIFNFDRLQGEELQRTLVRMTTNISKIVEKKLKKKRRKEKDVVDAANVNLEESLILNLYNAGSKIHDDTPNNEAWKEGSVLVIGNREYEVILNVPTVRSVILPLCIMSGFPQFPKVDAEFVDLERCQIKWYRTTAVTDETSSVERQLSGEDVNSDSSLNKQQKKKIRLNETKSDWEEVHTGMMYIPTNEDIGRKIKIVCIPVDGRGREGVPVEAFSKFEVTAGPGFCPFENRHAFTQTRTKHGSFRMVTYNILADLYADSDYSRDFLYPYCPPYALSIGYRKQLLIKEITGYNADIVCLQEMDWKLFVHDLQPAMQQQGFEGLAKMKTGQTPEGTAIFFRNDKFSLLSQHDMNMVEELQAEEDFRDVLDKISCNDSLKEKMLERTTAVQVALLESVEEPSKHVLVVTTHLYFHPRAAHIRILQALLCLRHIERVLRQCDGQGITPAVIFCGDFNSYPEGGVHELLKNKNISAHHADWYCCGKEEFIEGMEFSHSIDLTSACGFPRYTNFVTGFSGCLDYIYMDHTKLRVAEVIPMPTHEEVTQYTALPNPVFPSDHIALVCELDYKSS